MKLSEVYLEAARQMAWRREPKYSCWMINAVATNGKECAGWPDGKAGDYRRHYEKTIIPVESPKEFANRNERILALCLMAAIAKDEERSRKRRN